MARPEFRNWQIGTSLAHAGARQAAPIAQPISPPIYTSVTFVHPSAGELDRAFTSGEPVYSRCGNPTVAALESAVTVAENGCGAVAFASGMAALHAAILAAGTPRGSIQPGLRRILGASNLYGASRSLIRDFFGALGVASDFCDMGDLAAVEQCLQARPPDVVVLEPLSNPLLAVCDVAAIADLAHAAGARVVVDNTFATPVLLRPIELGADLVAHSATKYLGGHGDAVGGVVVARKQLALDMLRHYARLLGGMLGPFDACLITRGMQTLALRMRQHCANARRVAAWLERQPEVAWVRYPGLASHPQHVLAERLFHGLGGGVIAFELAHAERAAAYRLMDTLQLILPATSLGDVTSLICYPAVASHRELTCEERAEQGIGEGLLRLSVGIEEPDDLLADLAAALRATRQAQV